MSDSTPAATGGGATYTEATADGFTVDTNSGESAEEIKANITEPDDDDDEGEGDDVSKAASRLGKKGGEAAAKARKDKDDDKERDKAAAKSKEAKGEGADKGEDKKESPRTSAQARVEQATRKLAEERRRNQQLEDRLSRLEQERSRPEPRREEARPQPPARPPVLRERPDDPRPKEDQFDSYSDFAEALGRWAARQEYSQIRERDAAEQYARGQVEQLQRRGSEAKDLIDKARAAVPDLVERTDPRLWDLKPSWTLPPDAIPNSFNAIADGLLSAQEGNPEGFAAMMLYLTEHPDDVRRIAKMHPITALQAMARLEAIVSPTQQSGKPRREVSRAYPPISTPRGSASTVDEGSDDESFEAHVRRENARDRERVTRRR